jgi:methyl-accepting chemotaxis protein
MEKKMSKTQGLLERDNEVTQKNAALVEQAAAAESLVEQAIQLSDVESVFKLEGEAHLGLKSMYKASHVTLVKSRTGT